MLFGFRVVYADDRTWIITSSGDEVKINIGKKGDVERYLLWTIVLLVLLVVIIALVYGGAWNLIENLFIKKWSK
jgi:hypothetical protein